MARTSKEKSSVTHSPASLLAAVARIHAILVGPARVADDMRQRGIDELVISNQPSLLCAVNDLTRWQSACEEALNAHLAASGQFAALTPSKTKKRPR